MLELTGIYYICDFFDKLNRKELSLRHPIFDVSFNIIYSQTPFNKYTSLSLFQRSQKIYIFSFQKDHNISYQHSKLITAFSFSNSWSRLCLMEKHVSGTLKPINLHLQSYNVSIKQTFQTLYLSNYLSLE